MDKSAAASPFRWPDFRHLFVATACATFASRAMAVVLGYRVYALTNSPLALGGLGLVEAIPAISLALYGGHIADRRDRRSILRITLVGLTLCALALALLLEWIHVRQGQLFLLYAVVFIAGIARGFAEPAAGALEAQVVPRELLVNSSTLMATCWLIGAVVGPLVAGVTYATAGPGWTFLGIALIYLAAWLAILRIAPRPVPDVPAGESVWESVAVGVEPASV